MKLQRVFLNMGIDKIQDIFLSRACLETLKTLDPASVEPSSLKNLVLENMLHAKMLRDKKMRNTIVMSLKRDSAEILAKSLGAEKIDNVYHTLVTMTIAKNSSKEKRLFEFFEEEWTEYDSPDSPPSVDLAEASRPLFDHQIAAIEKIKHVLKDPGSRVLLHMPTGSGKTRTAMRAVADLFLENRDVLVIWLAYSEELCEQAINEFKSTWGYTGNRAIPVYRFFGKHSIDLLDPSHKTGLIVASLTKMYRAAQKETLFLTTLADRVSLVVIDEAHQAIADTYKFILSYLVEKHDVWLLGLSATPGRTWSDVAADRNLAEFFNRKKVTLDVGVHPIEFLVRRGFISRANVESIPYNGNLSDADREKIERSLDIPADILSKLANDVERNIVIIDRIEQLVRKRHTRIILFAASISHARDLSLVLHSRGHDAFYIDANTPRDVRDSIIKTYKEDTKMPRIICNFGVLTAGFDAPKTTAVLIARPTRSLVLYSQMVGRAIRGPNVGGTEECDIVTVTDINLPGFNSMVEAFSNWDDVWE